MASTLLLPTKSQLGQIAERRPEFLNTLVAVFVMEWRSAAPLVLPVRGVDQTGEVRVVPDFVGSWGVDRCVHYLLRCPPYRSRGSEGFVSRWLQEISEDSADVV